MKTACRNVLNEQQTHEIWCRIQSFPQIHMARQINLALTTLSSLSKHHHHFLSVEMATRCLGFLAGAVSTTRTGARTRNQSMLWQPIYRTLSTGHFSDSDITCQRHTFTLTFCPL